MRTKKTDRFVQDPKQTNSPNFDIAILSVSKDVSCQPSTNIDDEITACREVIRDILPNDFNIAISESNPGPTPSPSPSHFKGSSIPGQVFMDPGHFKISETADPSVSTDLANIEDRNFVHISQSIVFSGDCNPITGEGVISESDLQQCSINNMFTATH